MAIGQCTLPAADENNIAWPHTKPHTCHVWGMKHSTHTEDTKWGT